AEVGAGLATRALARASATPGPDGRPVLSSALTERTTFALLWTERYDPVGPLVDASIAEARVTGDSGRLAVALATRGWLALRLGDLNGAETDAVTALASTELPAPPMYRVLNAGVLVDALVAQGELAAAEDALAPPGPEVERGSLTAAVLRL